MLAPGDNTEGRKTSRLEMDAPTVGLGGWDMGLIDSHERETNLAFIRTWARQNLDRCLLLMILKPGYRRYI